MSQSPPKQPPKDPDGDMSLSSTFPPNLPIPPTQLTPTNSIETEPSNRILDPNLDFKNDIMSKTNYILKKISEGKSVTKVNKDEIIKVVKEIQTATVYFCGAANQSATPAPSNFSELTDSIGAIVRKEITALKKSLESPKAPPMFLESHKAPVSSHKPQPPLYSQALLKTKATFKPALIVQPKTKTANSTETLLAWQKSVSFRDTNFAPANTKLISSNRLKVTFDNPNQINTVLNKINNPDCLVTAAECKKLKPMFILKGINSSTPPEILTDLLISQNENIKTITTGKEDIIYKFKRNNRNPALYNAVFLTTPAVWKAAVEGGKVNIDHQRVHIGEYVPLLHCYKCMQLGHTRKWCKNSESICSHCSSNAHDFANCPDRSNPEKLKCVNCSKRNSSHSHAHSPTSEHCPIVQKAILDTRSRIDYSN